MMYTGRQMNDSLEPSKVVGADVPDVFPNRRNRYQVVPEIAAFVQVRVEADDLMPTLAEHLDHHRTDVSVVSCNEYFHETLQAGGFVSHLLAPASNLWQSKESASLEASVKLDQPWN